jgi:hypothetical protein
MNSCAGRNNAAGNRVVGWQPFFGRAVVVGAHHVLVEVFGVDDVYADVLDEFFNADINSFIHLFRYSLIQS